MNNTIWYGLENLISIGSSFITSVAIARELGPSQMGYIIYVIWIANIASTFGSIGIPVTTRKYMAEYLGAGDRATARFIYLRTFIVQAMLATLATAVSLLWVLHDAPPAYKTASVILLLSIWPAMLNFVSAQANVAAEQLSANLPASLASMLVFLSVVLLAVFRHWGVVGVASAMFAMRFVDFAIRVLPTARRILRWNPENKSIPQHLYKRMATFALQSLASMVLTLVVWDRSELFLLKHLSADIRQIAFYSVAFNLAERLLIFPNVFAGAAGASMFVQHGRDRTRVPMMVAASIRYLTLSSIPLYAIAIPLAGPAVLLLYGRQYAGAVAVAMAAPLLCLPKAFLAPIQNLFEASEEQRYFIWATILASFVDVGIAWALVPHYGALGACIGSGAAQTVAIGILWMIGIKRYQIPVPWKFVQKIVAASVAASLAAYLIASHLSAATGLFAGGTIAIVTFLVLIRFFGVLEREDWGRFAVVLGSCPPLLVAPVRGALSLMGLPMKDKAVLQQEPLT